MTDPATRAWQAVRDSVGERAATYERDGYDVVTAFADHGAFAAEDTDGQVLSFTVGSDTAEAVAGVAEEPVEESQVSVADADGIRFLTVETVGRDSVLVLAGGVEHEQLRAHAREEPVRVAVRRLDGTTAAVFEHDRVAPFVASLPG